MSPPSGASVAAIDLAVAPAGWAALGFTVDDDACAVGQTLLRLGRGAAGISGWALRDASGDGPVDGIATERAGWPQPAGSAPANRAVRVDHVVVASGDVDRTYAALEAAGMALRKEIDIGRGRQGFFRHGECVVEVVGPHDADGGPATLWGLTITVADLDATAALLGERLGRVKDAVQPGRRIATLRSEAGLGVPLALMSA